MDTGSALQRRWLRLAEILGLEVVANYEVTLTGGARVSVPILLRDFGGASGMLLTADYSDLKPALEDLAAAGYGFAVLGDEYDDAEVPGESLFDLLSDWGWMGDAESKPVWCRQ